MLRLRLLVCIFGGLLVGAVGLIPPAGAQSTPAVRRPAAPHYDVVALRVEFQPDTTRFTTGDGTFEGPLYAEGLAPNVDPLPHDAAYFQAHLDFLADYVASSSDGHTQITTHLLPGIVRVSGSMGAYSPTGFDADSDPERAKLAALVAEAWQAAARQIPFDFAGFDPQRTAFVLFHAGVGRDVELLGTTLDKTPLDLPSIAFDERALGKLGVSGIAFNGFPIRNTLVMPRTETRQAFDFFEDRPFLLELSTNGLLAASFFNFLGVPDLFNTATGEPAIGPFGLMDPLGIFALGGLFPPEPSAWTKAFLGWTQPRLLTDERLEVTLAAAGTGAQDAVARASISAAEYFLVEHRHRDPEGDGLVLRVWKDGALVEQRVQNGDEGFNAFDVRGFVGGVVVGVDNYDWALPGGLDEDGNVLNGGLLIWHVDERRLAAGLADNTVNADPTRRAVDLEEADSAQDLGFPSNNPFGAGAEQGTPFDFFYAGNPVTAVTATGQQIRLYQNRFGPDTFPNSNSNEGGPSFIVIEDISAPGVEMSFVYRRAAAAGVEELFVSHVATEDDTPFGEGAFVGARPAQGSGWLVYSGDAGPVEQIGVLNAETGTLQFAASSTAALRPVLDAQGRIFYAEVMPLQNIAGVVLNVLEDDGPRRVAAFMEADVEVSDLASPLVALPQGEQSAFYVVGTITGARTGAIALEMFEDGTVNVLTLRDQPVLALASDGTRAVLIGPRGARVQGGADEWIYDLPVDATLGQPAFGSDDGGLVGIVPVLDSDELLILQAGGAVRRIDVGRYAGVLDSPATLNRFPVLADLDDDGRLDVLTTYGPNLVAFSQDGALVRGFPIALTAAAVAQPLVVRLTEGGAWSIVVASTDGYVYAYDLGAGGQTVPGFPLAVGSRAAATPLLQEKKLYALSVEGELHAWALDGAGEIGWGQLYGDAWHRSYMAGPTPVPQPSPPPAGLIVDAETYNWPNPVRAGQTFLRCMTSEDARVHITIVDVAGSLVDEFEMDLHGSTPAEHLWQTDAPSGLYYARVTATAPGGQTATKLIKMAVIR